MDFPSVYSATHYPDTQSVQLSDLEGGAEIAIPYQVFRQMTEQVFHGHRADRIMLRLQCGGSLTISWAAGRAGFPSVEPGYAERAIAAMMAPAAIEEELSLEQDGEDVDVLRRSFRGLVEVK
jgi:hypothetical protein